jgi:hypothetical protein
MKNLFYAFSLFIIVSSCSKKSSEPDPVIQYKRATAELKQQITVYGAGEKANVTMYLKFVDNVKAKPSKITGIDVFSANNKIYTIQNQDVSSEYVVINFVYAFQTTALKEGSNTFTYTLQYEDGFQQKGSVSIYAIKDKKIGAWWDKISFAYLDTVPAVAKFAIPIKDVSEVKGGMTGLYSSKQPTRMLIDGLYGFVYSLFDNEKKLQAIYVFHGTNQFDSGINLNLIKADMLAEYPDCVVTELPDKSGYLLKNSTFIFKVYKAGNDYFTEVKKNN